MKRAWAGILVSVLLILTGCQAPAEPVVVAPTEAVIEATEAAVEGVVYPLTFVDGLGRTLVIEKEPVRVITLAPSMTETIYALGAQDKLVGRTDYCTYPPESQAVQSVGTLQEPNIETIVDLNPDLIIASTHFNDETLKKLEELDLTVAVITAQESFEGLYQVIEQVGLVLNTEANAAALVETISSRVSSILEKVQGLEKPTVYYAVAFGESGEYTAGGDTFIHQMIEMAGGDNIAKDISGWNYSLEQLVEKDPQVVIVSNKWDSKNLFMSGENYKLLSAVINNQVLEVDEDLVQVQGPRLVDGLEALVKALHPELN